MTWMRAIAVAVLALVLHGLDQSPPLRAAELGGAHAVITTSDHDVAPAIASTSVSNADAARHATAIDRLVVIVHLFEDVVAPRARLTMRVAWPQLPRVFGRNVSGASPPLV